MDCGKGVKFTAILFNSNTCGWFLAHFVYARIQRGGGGSTAEEAERPERERERERTGRQRTRERERADRERKRERERGFKKTYQKGSLVLADCHACSTENGDRA